PPRTHLLPFPTRRSSDLSPLYGLLGLLTQKPGFLNKNWLPASDSTYHRGDAGIVTIPNTHGLALFKIDPVEVLNKRSHEVLACLDRKSTRLNSSHVSISY